jgi:photosystem II stability/assembly factor-like uncharacterized protein
MAHNPLKMLLLFLLTVSFPMFGLDTLTWTVQRSGVTQTLWSIYFTDTLHGWAAGNYGSVVRTADGGQTWSRCAFSYSDSLQAIVFADPARGWMAGTQGGIHASADSGKSWVLDTLKARTWYNAAWLLDSQTVFFAGATNPTGTGSSYTAFINRTANAGATWIGLTLPDPYQLSSICFAGPSRGWAAGMDKVTATSNGGQSWGTAYDPLTGSYKGYVNKVWFVDSMRGFGIGRYGGIMRCGTGGWSFLDTTSGSWLESICFADPAHGVIAGERGLIASSSDSGKSWRRTYPRHQSSLWAPWFRSVWFVDVRHGWTCGDSGLIMKGSFVTVPLVAARPESCNRGGVHAVIAVMTSSGCLRIQFPGPVLSPQAVSLYSLNGDLIGRAVVPESGYLKMEIRGTAARALILETESLRRVIVPGVR